MVKPFLRKTLSALLEIARAILKGFHSVISTFLKVLLKDLPHPLRNDAVNVMYMIIRLEVYGFPTNRVAKHSREVLQARAGAVKGYSKPRLEGFPDFEVLVPLETECKEFPRAIRLSPL